MDDTANLKLPFIMAAQAQKHVTHNEALRGLDAVVQLSVMDRDLSTAPASPSDGDRYIVGASASGEWAGHEGQVAAFQDNAWMYYLPREGWLCWVADEDKLVVRDGSSWSELSGGGGSVNPVALVGVNATADTTNRLSVSSPATLFNHEGNGHQQKINKNTVSDTASTLFQSGFSGRAEIGLTGDDDFHFKVSNDGSNWIDALFIDKDNGFFGVGTTSPSQPLNIVKDDASTHYVKVESVQAQNAGFQFVTPTTTWYAYNQNSSQQWRFYNGGTRLAIAASGEIGIGTTTLTEKLNVAGNIAPASDNLHDLGTASKRWDDIYATNGTIQTSDRRNKKNIKPLSYGLDLISALRPVQFHWKDHVVEVEEEGDDGQISKRKISVSHSRRHFGLIAQDVKKALEKCGCDDFAGWTMADKKRSSSKQGLRYSELIAPLVRAVQELAEKVHKLEKKQ